ncbi:hypothetical protein HK099_004888 [Clydaea vesicula]|uniref:Ubiquinone biosynthesis monooxygenase COQ7 n=1 Tax=Clydaea vesicula TaxID=447962 RepID=A0AAD5U7Z2_9FUNG|nr:hypothetical protein HK099_004888 [Clydaea vesicula]
MNKKLTPKQIEMIHSMLRVDQAGEIGADSIYKGQHYILKNNQTLGPLIQHMWDQEKHHLSTMNKLVAEHRVRPSLLEPVWKTAGFALGTMSALLGKESAMALTEAVETVIGEHYNDQIRELLLIEGVEEIDELREIIKKFRDEELEHLNLAVDNDSKTV